MTAHHIEPHPRRPASARERQVLTVVGCDCNPEVEIEPDAEQPNLFHEHVFHDDWCALLQRHAGRQGRN